MNWLRQRREELGLTQDELTARLQTEGLDISRSTLSHWEVGRFKPPLGDKASRDSLARALRMSVKEMLKRSGYDVTLERSEAAERAAYLVDQMDEDMQDKAVRILETLL